MIESTSEGEELFRLLLGSARDAIFILNEEGKVSFWNKAAEKKLGYPSEEILHQKIDLVFPSAKLSGFFKEAGAEIGEPLELIAVRKDAGEIPIEVSVSTQRIKGAGYLLGVVRNIAGRKRIEEELSQEQDLLRALMEHSDDCIYFKDRDSRFIRSSAKMAKLFQAGSPEEMIGKHDSDYFTADHWQPALEDEKRILESGVPLSGKAERETWPDGHVTWALTSKLPLLNKAGEIVGTFGISKDITDIKESEAKLTELHRQYVDASREAGMAEVATSVLHNVGNVLNSVNISHSFIAERLQQSSISYVEKMAGMLKEHSENLAGFFNEDERGRKLPELIGKLAHRLMEERNVLLKEVRLLGQNIDHIKDIVTVQQSYAHAGGVWEVLPLADLVEDALRFNSLALQRHNVAVVREIEKITPFQIDKHKVLQILVNLVSNAKHALDGKDFADKQLKIKLTREGDTAVLSVIDKGVGIAPENMSKIFSHGFTTKKDGHGFGLHSAALAAQQLGGRLTAHSDGPNLGATFTLELPIDPKPLTPQ